MDLHALHRLAPCAWEIPRQDGMHVPALIYASEALVREMDEKVREQATNVARLPGIVAASYAMPDAHWGYGFPIGGVAAFDAEAGGVVSAGGVGFDISCGVRCLHTGLGRADIVAVQRPLADALFEHIPAGVGSTGAIHLNSEQMHDMLTGGARWAVSQGWGSAADLERIEEHGCMAGARPDFVSDKAKQRQAQDVPIDGSKLIERPFGGIVGNHLIHPCAQWQDPKNNLADKLRQVIIKWFLLQAFMQDIYCGMVHNINFVKNLQGKAACPGACFH